MLKIIAMALGKPSMFRGFDPDQFINNPASTINAKTDALQLLPERYCID